MVETNIFLNVGISEVCLHMLLDLPTSIMKYLNYILLNGTTSWISHKTISISAMSLLTKTCSRIRNHNLSLSIFASDSLSVKERGQLY